MNNIIVLALILLISTVSALTVNQRKADTIYLNGSIITMAGWQPQYVEAVAVSGSKIIFAGKKKVVL